MYHVPLIGLAYQMGALFREPVELPSWQYYIAFLLSAFSSIFAIQSPMLLFLAIFFLSLFFALYQKNRETEMNLTRATNRG